MATKLIYQTALLSTGWAHNVAVSVNDRGDIVAIETGVNGAQPGVLVPGLSNLHSHAHQRAMAGLAERAGDTPDSFWTWRKTMYAFLDAMQPRHLLAIASQLYLEMLSTGYTRVAEFQYLHHQQDGRGYDNPAEMSLQTLEAARHVGIGITNLPVHYQFGGFGEQAISAQQARFYNKPEDFLRIVESLSEHCKGDANTNVGVAGHSLRATSKQAFGEVLAGVDGMQGLAGQSAPIHIHIAEQVKEIEDCIKWSGARPVDYCLDSFDVDKRWCLIHATHMSDSETLRLAQSGAVAGLCPTTEANLGDGFFNATEYLAAGGALGIGSDSHISTSPVEELRWFEYGQRLMHKSRNQLAGGANRNTGRTLFDVALKGGAQACGQNSGSIAVGMRADFVVLDSEHPLLVAKEQDEIIDSWIFSGNANPIKDVYVGGKQVISNGAHAQQESINKAFRQTLKELRNM